MLPKRADVSLIAQSSTSCLRYNDRKMENITVVPSWRPLHRKCGLSYNSRCQGSLGRPSESKALIGSKSLQYSRTAVGRDCGTSSTDSRVRMIVSLVVVFIERCGGNAGLHKARGPFGTGNESAHGRISLRRRAMLERKGSGAGKVSHAASMVLHGKFKY